MKIMQFVINKTELKDREYEEEEVGGGTMEKKMRNGSPIES